MLSESPRKRAHGFESLIFRQEFLGRSPSWSKASGFDPDISVVRIHHGLPFIFLALAQSGTRASAYEAEGRKFKSFTRGHSIFTECEQNWLLHWTVNPASSGIRGSSPWHSTILYPCVAQLAARVLWEHEAAGSRPAARTTLFRASLHFWSVSSAGRALPCPGCGHGFDSRTGRHSSRLDAPGAFSFSVGA